MRPWPTTAGRQENILHLGSGLGFRDLRIQDLALGSKAHF